MKLRRPFRYFQKFTVTLNKPKSSNAFTETDEFIQDLEQELAAANRRWRGDREMEIMTVHGDKLELEYSTVDLDVSDLSLSRYVGGISKKLYGNRRWDRRVCQKANAVFHVNRV
ncbi:hypothetical protein [Clostridium sp.]|uniref:hypothetical protein n=1 Tax=Clostridium sp. TaxID=1506 RepID=UPI003D6CCED0